MQRGLVAAAAGYQDLAAGDHAEVIARIGRADPALLHRVEELEDEARLLQHGWRALCEQVQTLSACARKVAPDEAAMQDRLTEFTENALEFVLRTRRQMASVRTWTFEAYARDRGEGD